MKILTGIKKSEFLNNYCVLNKENQFLLIDTIDNTYPFTANNLLLLKSDKNNWLNDIIDSDKELSKDVVFILFTNDIVNNTKDYITTKKELQIKAEYYLGKLNLISRDFIIVLKMQSENFKAYIEYVELGGN